MFAFEFSTPTLTSSKIMEDPPSEDTGMTVIAPRPLRSSGQHSDHPLVLAATEELHFILLGNAISGATSPDENASRSNLVCYESYFDTDPSFGEGFLHSAMPMCTPPNRPNNPMGHNFPSPFGLSAGVNDAPFSIPQCSVSTASISTKTTKFQVSSLPSPRRHRRCRSLSMPAVMCGAA
eukprot:TRINITY_DN2218_c0_g1_i2.p1 TRINITY_DN2218_c0_g1~~TRINITY_DN2218_c0_g1_i2.p1  ORF type:complete len:209 (+),score=16.59 TRINITY_DN2218_c0_g1_i2:93-629(+)